MSELTGRTFPEFTFRVEGAKVEEFLFALDEHNPIYKATDGADKTGLPVPPTFLNPSIQTGITGAHPVDSMSISRSRAVHAGQDYEFMAPVHVGDVITGQSTVSEVVEKEGRSGKLRFLTLETRFRRGSEEVAIVRTRVAERLGKPS